MTLFRILAPRIAGILSILLVRHIPALEGAEEAVTSAILAVWGVFEIAMARNDQARREYVTDDQIEMRDAGVYKGKIDGKPLAKTLAAKRVLRARPHRRISR
jgi:hypothetical protein